MFNFNFRLGIFLFRMTHTYNFQKYFFTNLLSETSRDNFKQKINKLSYAINFNDIETDRRAAVLMPLCVVDGEVSLLYTLRSLQLKAHRGQVAFPGGMAEEGETAIQTALREAVEEIGIDKKNTEIWCQMPPLPTVSEVTVSVTPVIGVLNDFDFNKLVANKSEVEEIFTVPLRHLADKNNHAHLLYTSLYLPVYEYNNYKIWGITGLLTHYLLQSILPPHVYQPDFKRKKYLISELRAKL